LKLIIFTQGRQPGVVDEHLARFLDLPTRIVNQAAKRSVSSFTRKEIRYQMSQEEFGRYRESSNIERTWGGRRYFPYVYNFYGVCMIIGRLRLNLSSEQKQNLLAAFGESRFPIIDYGEHRQEESITHRLKKILDGILTVRIHYPVATKSGNYYIDAYIEELNLAIEVDEESHRWRTKADQARQQSIVQTLNCEFLRFSETAQIDKCINQVLRRIPLEFGKDNQIE
jgi:very-short-patch-repair endonuclease